MLFNIKFLLIATLAIVLALASTGSPVNALEVSSNEPAGHQLAKREVIKKRCLPKTTASTTLKDKTTTKSTPSATGADEGVVSGAMGISNEMGSAFTVAAIAGTVASGAIALLF